MKQKHASVLKIILIVLMVEIVLSGMYYLLVYDKNRPKEFQPQVNSLFYRWPIKSLNPVTENTWGEIIINEKDFDGIFGYSFAKEGTYEIEKYIDYLDFCGGGYAHIVYPDDSYEVYVGDIIYENILDAWQYGWWDRDGNRYADVKGDDAAKGKPNYRYHYRFLILKNNDLYSVEMFCNTDDAEKVFYVCVENINKLE